MAPSGARKKNRHTEGRQVLEDGRVRQRDIRLSFAIMAHPKRRDWVDSLEANMPKATVVWDRVNDRHDTGLRSILAYDREATHHVVVQDDSILGLDFAKGLEKALSYVDPGAPVGLYYGAKGSVGSAHAIAVDFAVQNGASWVVRKGPVWGPAIVFPVDTINELVTYFKSSSTPNYDRRVMEFYQSNGVDCWYSVPSMVDHRTDGNASLAGHDWKGPRAARVFSGPQSLLDVGWDGPVVRFRR